MTRLPSIRLTSLKLRLPWVHEVELAPDQAERAAAWALYVELVARVVELVRRVALQHVVTSRAVPPRRPGAARAAGFALASLLLAAACRDATGPDPVTTPARPDAGAGDLAAVTAGYSVTCALDQAGRPYCWGLNFRGELVAGDTATFLTRPTPVAGIPAPLQAIAAGGDHQCALAADGRAYCWGTNLFGQLGTGATSTGIGTRAPGPAPVAGGLVFRSISAGFSHTCAVTAAGAAYCWGANAYGQLGAGAGAPCDYTDPVRCVAAVPVPVAGGLVFRQVSVGRWHTCGVTADDVAYCWGHNQDGELGDPTVPIQCGAFPERAACLRDVPVPIAGGLRFRQVAAGGLHSCGLTTAGAAYCWGLVTGDAAIGAYELGNPAVLGSPSGPRGSRVPVAVEGGLTFSDIAVGTSGSCALTAAGRAVCWGSNNFGQMGVGGTDPTASTRPLAVGMPAAAAAPVPTEDDHVCALTTTGRIWCWGGDNYFCEHIMLPLSASG